MHGDRRRALARRLRLGASNKLRRRGSGLLNSCRRVRSSRGRYDGAATAQGPRTSCVRSRPRRSPGFGLGPCRHRAPPDIERPLPHGCASGVASSQSCGGIVPKSLSMAEASPNLPGGRHLCHGGVGVVSTC
jgi:hypothetical protein